MKESAIRVVVADDQDLVRSGYRAILGTYPDIVVVGEARDGEEAVLVAQRLKPDVVLMDVRMPRRNGIEATRDITANPTLARTHVLVLTTFDIDMDVRMPRRNGIEATRDITANPTLARTHVLVLTTFDIDEYVYDALAVGASGFLLKDADPDDIAAAVRVVAAGDALIQPSVMKRLVERFVATRPRAGAPGLDAGRPLAQTLSGLTDREREILGLVARGLSNDEIGAELFISPATVKTHLARVMAKTGAHDRAGLVVFAYESGLVAPGA